MSSVFSVDKPEDSPGFLLWQTTITWQRLIKKALDIHNISHAQFVILAITLWHESKNHEVSQSLIIRQSKLDKMTVSKSFKKLVTEGYVKRMEHKEDTRAKAVYLTRKGKELISKLIPIVEKIDANFFGILKKNDQQSLINVLNNLISKMDVSG
ncbi:MAG: MarR family winged helix-turn-helix transcriptional regulator [Gammaproteobacteria bacterium]